MKTTKVSTWLPLFSGFYGTIWETSGNEEMELENINDLRKEKGLEPVEWDALDFDYDAYQKDVVEGVTNGVGQELIKEGYIQAYKLEKLSSPREYNFANDSIHVSMTLTEKNKRNIKMYLKANAKSFAIYLKDRYTAYSGFCSSYSNNIADWIDPVDYSHEHKLGSILEFILTNENQLTETDIYENLTSNGVTISANNYSELVEVKS